MSLNGIHCGTYQLIYQRRHKYCLLSVPSKCRIFLEVYIFHVLKHCSHQRNDNTFWNKLSYISCIFMTWSNHSNIQLFLLVYQTICYNTDFVLDIQILWRSVAFVFRSSNMKFSIFLWTHLTLVMMRQIYDHEGEFVPTMGHFAFSFNVQPY